MAAAAVAAAAVATAGSPANAHPGEMSPPIEGVHHLGIRVADEARSVAFYQQLGFSPVYRDQRDPVVILKNQQGVEINLILNASLASRENVLMDVPEKHPGYTHVAYRVEDIEAMVGWLDRTGIEITEGPVRLGAGRSLFVRDPDRNVLEFRQDDAPVGSR